MQKGTIYHAGAKANEPIQILLGGGQLGDISLPGQDGLHCYLDGTVGLLVTQDAYKKGVAVYEVEYHYTIGNGIANKVEGENPMSCTWCNVECCQAI
jgi:hypothetical protein